MVLILGNRKNSLVEIFISLGLCLQNLKQSSGHYVYIEYKDLMQHFF